MPSATVHQLQAVHPVLAVLPIPAVLAVDNQNEIL